MKKGRKLNIQQIREIFMREAKKNNLQLEEKRSLSSQSHYFLLKDEEGRGIYFRVSDHVGNTKLKTLRYDHHLSEEIVSRFIKNRITVLRLSLINEEFKKNEANILR